ncbi:putative RNA-binding protein Nova-1 [Toxoplasma gondii TgCatPRC2]|uniref:KH domain-containing protein n=4 Tax=Toxoplasma gondii TaxID=5811 RepID=B6KU32_TOXGV|nr:RNA-binding protein Nova-1, putative [Toxoplasma gondii ME49]ESS34066.1 putative RNA-binding protein Nova-1 [Toxoplasma gondii VEG]KYF49025.1 putative RNA-binding protein Nova-1 [Toxoplasma gondii ARI]KYK66969.1 putative RNA-binding protein Nova-1 [Toxoplasma gondii TgCatPRC2]EPT24774.1 RNA-binding protein Nova-1, putative [Toxoplasma gondii ME49]CEL78252.1 TPA: KH domain-containing protein [Toxoplasma gondii VEG]|eukprot:XP_002371355.1 RNA-binding protein Nova-1, putative [Toxoplasma gondii ME49]
METSSTPSTKRSAFQGPCYLKMIVNNVAAGAIIGKNGIAIAAMEQQTGCALKLSPLNAFYPGTQDRVLVMSGEQEQVNNALVLILGKIKETVTSHFGTSGTQSGAQAGSTGSGSPELARQAFGSDAAAQHKITCRLAVPRSAVSTIIGKGGQQIRELQDTTGARVQVSSREEGLAERMITISGVLEQVRAAALGIASCIQSDPYLRDHMHVVYKPGAPGGGATLGAAPGGLGGALGGPGYCVVPNVYGNAPYGGGGHLYGHGAAGHSAAADALSLQCEISLQVPDQSIGAVIGRNGACVTEVINATGARVQISQKGDLVPGTNDRKIVLSGTVGAVHSAHLLLLQRIHAVQDGAGGKHSAAGPVSVQGGPSAASSGNGMGAAGGPLELHSAVQQPHGLQGNLHYLHSGGYGY